MERDWTGHEIAAEERRILDETAHALGLVVMEFARLEFNLGMRIANELPRLEAKAGDTLFAQRIGILEDAARRRFDKQPVMFANYLAWIVEANALRAERNRMVHGRWTIEANKGVARNVIGLPFEEKPSKSYQVEDLLAFRDRIAAASKALQALPSVWGSSA